MERGITFPTGPCVVFSQSQCNVPVGQSEQTVLCRKEGQKRLTEAGYKGPTVFKK